MGTRTPCCVFCGETAPECLELEHPTGRARDPSSVYVICKNCHAKKHKDFQDAGIPMLGESAPKALTKMRLRAMAEHHRMLAEAFDHWADEIEE